MTTFEALRNVRQALRKTLSLVLLALGTEIFALGYRIAERTEADVQDAPTGTCAYSRTGKHDPETHMADVGHGVIGPKRRCSICWEPLP